MYSSPVLIFALLALTAAGSRPLPTVDDTSTGPEGQKSSSKLHGQQPKVRGVWFSNLDDGATVHSPVQLSFGIAGRKVRAVRDGLMAGSGHFHILIDLPEGEQVPAEGTEIPFDAAHKHYGKGQEGDFEGLLLTPGWHTLSLVLADHEHVSFGPEFVAVIRVHVIDDSMDGVHDLGNASPLPAM